MKIIVYCDVNGSSLVDIFRKNNYDISVIRGSIENLKNEIFFIKPYAVILPEDLHNGTAVSLITDTSIQKSGIGSLFFVHGVSKKEETIKCYRVSGAAEVFPVGTTTQSIFDYINNYIIQERLNGFENSDAKLSKSKKTMIRNVTRTTLRRAGIEESEKGFYYLLSIINRIVVDNANPTKMGDLYEMVAQKKHTNAHAIQQSVRRAINIGWKRTPKKRKPSTFQGYESAPKPKHAIMLLVEEVRRGVKGIELDPHIKS